MKRLKKILNKKVSDITKGTLERDEKASVIKKEIVDELFERANKTPSLIIQLQNLGWYLRDLGEEFFPKHAYPQCIAKEAISQVVSQWAGSSSKGEFAVAIQLSIFFQFGLQNVNLHRLAGVTIDGGEVTVEGNRFFPKHQKAIMGVAQIMKEHTSFLL